MEPPHYITLASNGCLKLFKENTLTRFTNVLPWPVYPRSKSPGDYLLVRIRSLLISPQLESANPFAHHINILLSEAGQQPVAPQNTRFTGLLESCEFPGGTQTDEYCLYHFDEAPFIELDAFPLFRLSLLITDSQGEQLNLAYGPATFVTLEMTDRRENRQWSTVAFSNDAHSLTRYPSNKLSSFTYALPTRLRLYGWEAAIRSVSFPNNFKVKGPPFWWEVKQGSSSQKFDYEVTDYATTSALVNKLKGDLAESETFKQIVSFTRSSEQATMGKIQITASGDNPVLISFSRAFSTFMGEDRLGETLTVGQSMLFGHPDIERVRPSSVGLLYCSLIKNNLVSDTLTDFMEMVPLKAGKAVFSPHHMTFHGLNDQYIDHIRFTIKQPDGTDHAFECDRGGGLGIHTVYRPTVASLRKDIHSVLYAAFDQPPPGARGGDDGLDRGGGSSSRGEATRGNDGEATVPSSGSSLYCDQTQPQFSTLPAARPHKRPKSHWRQQAADDSSDEY